MHNAYLLMTVHLYYLDRGRNLQPLNLIYAVHHCNPVHGESIDGQAPSSPSTPPLRMGRLFHMPPALTVGKESF